MNPVHAWYRVNVRLRDSVECSSVHAKAMGTILQWSDHYWCLLFGLSRLDNRFRQNFVNLNTLKFACFRAPHRAQNALASRPPAIIQFDVSWSCIRPRDSSSLTQSLIISWWYFLWTKILVPLLSFFLVGLYSATASTSSFVGSNGALIFSLNVVDSMSRAIIFFLKDDQIHLKRLSSRC